MKAKANFYTAADVVKDQMDSRKRDVEHAKRYLQSLREAKARLMPVLKSIAATLKSMGIKRDQVSIYVNHDTSLMIVVYDMASYKNEVFTGLLSTVLKHCDLGHTPTATDHDYTPARTYECRTANDVTVYVKGYLDSKIATCKIEQVTETQKIIKYKVTCN